MKELDLINEEKVKELFEEHNEFSELLNKSDLKETLALNIVKLGIDEAIEAWNQYKTEPVEERATELPERWYSEIPLDADKEKNLFAATFKKASEIFKEQNLIKV